MSIIRVRKLVVLFFFFNDTATTEIYTLSLHDALPILGVDRHRRGSRHWRRCPRPAARRVARQRIHAVPYKLMTSSRFATIAHDLRERIALGEFGDVGALDSESQLCARD